DGPYRLTIWIRSPKISVHLLTSEGKIGSPASRTCLSARKYSGFNPKPSIERNSEGTQWTRFILCRSIKSIRLLTSSEVLVPGRPQIVPPAHNGTKRSRKYASKEGEVNWLILAPSAIPNVSISHLTK